jgi:predicted nucleic acid-binding protein
MTALVFVDTNVFLYSLDMRDTAKQMQAQKWINACWQRSLGRISTQVLNEFYNNAITKFSRYMTKDVARETVRNLRLWQPPHLDTYTIDGAWQLQDRFMLSYWDALVVSSAQQQGCRFLLSEDLQDRQQFDSVLKINPFNCEPDEILGPT